MSDQKYNGWTNYETWNWNLWMDNDQGSQEYWSEIAQEILNGAESSYDWQTDKEAAQIELADRLKDNSEEWLEEWMPDQSSAFTDILNAGMSRVNWHEIAESLLDDIEVAA